MRLFPGHVHDDGDQELEWSLSTFAVVTRLAEMSIRPMCCGLHVITLIPCRIYTRSTIAANLVDECNTVIFG